MPREPIELELLPHERAALLKWNFTPQVQDQIKTRASSDDVETITLSPVDLNWLASDLTHAIVKRGCRDADVIDAWQRPHRYPHDGVQGGLEIVSGVDLPGCLGQCRRRIQRWTHRVLHTRKQRTRTGVH